MEISKQHIGHIIYFKDNFFGGCYGIITEINENSDFLVRVTILNCKDENTNPIDGSNYPIALSEIKAIFPLSKLTRLANL